MRGLVLLCALALAAPALAATYEVGPGQPLANVRDVPWESLQPGDLVLIHWQAAPYKDKWVIGVSGTAAAPITVRGVLGPGGERPVIDGVDAITRPQLNYWNEERGLLKIGGANVPADTLPQYIVVENLDLGGARQPATFTGRNGVTAYAQNAAAVYVEKGQHITLRNLVIRDSGNGLFVAASAGETQDVLVEGCDVRGNGNVGSIYEHNSYTEALGIVFQYNHYGPLCSGCGGNNLKDRSAGLVVRYNWIEAGNRNLDLVDAEDSAELVADPSYHTTYVYGNVLVKTDATAQGQVLHYGGDSGTPTDYRKGTLYFYNNTVVSTRAGYTTLMRLSTNEEHADCRDNVLLATAAGSNFALLDDTGALDYGHNWLKTGFVPSHGTVSGTITDLGGNVTGADPGLVDVPGQDYHLLATSACRDAGGALASGVPAPALEYVRHQQWEVRPVDATLDIGAFEYGTVPDGGPPLQEDAGVPPEDAAPQPTDGATPADAPAPPADGSPAPDAPAATDAPAPTPDGAHPGAVESGCGCTATPGAAAGWAALALLGLALSRRRNQRSR
jgi:MYXO-CTERM domain-containing protein